MGNYVEFYERVGSGRSPTRSALVKFQQVSQELLEAMEAAIMQLSSAESLSGTWVEKVDRDLWCLRVRSKGGWARLFFTKLKNGTYMLLNGFVKKSNKIPKRELKKARLLVREVQYAR